MFQLKNKTILQKTGVESTLEPHTRLTSPCLAYLVCWLRAKIETTQSTPSQNFTTYHQYKLVCEG